MRFWSMFSFNFVNYFAYFNNNLHVLILSKSYVQIFILYIIWYTKKPKTFFLI